MSARGRFRRSYHSYFRVQILRRIYSFYALPPASGELLISIVQIVAIKSQQNELNYGGDDNMGDNWSGVEY